MSDTKISKGREWIIIFLILCLFSYALYINLDWFVYAHQKRGNLEPKIEFYYMLFGLAFSFLGVLLTYRAFIVQYNFNERQKDDIDRDRFDNLYFNFLTNLQRLEKQCSIPNIGNGKQCFHFMYYEFRAIYKQFKSSLKGVIPEDKIYDIIEKGAFLIFLNGVSKSSFRRIEADCISMGLDEEAIGKVKEQHDKFLENQKGEMKDNGVEMPDFLTDYNSKSGILLYDGHRLRLIPFMRSINMFIEFISTIEASWSEKYEFYIKTLIAQLSEHELALLCIFYELGAEEIKMNEGKADYKKNLETIKKYGNLSDKMMLKHFREE